MSNGGVMLSGWLRKSPPENKLKSRHHSWKKRWFVLKSGRLSGDPNVLEYSKYQTSKKPIKIIDLNDCMQIDANVTIPIKSDKKDGSEHFIFSIVTSSRTFYLIADSIREMSTWVQRLCDLCGFDHDSNDKGDLGRQKQTFKALGPTNRTLNENKDIRATLLTSGTSAVPGSSPRPAKTLTNASKPIDHSLMALQNGTVNSSFTHPSVDGYQESHSKLEMGFQPSGHDPEVTLNQTDAAPLTLPVLGSPEVADTSEYLRLADCDTGACDVDPGFLSVDKTDTRRCSTDSVFAHDDGPDDSKDNDSLTAPIILPAKSRFLQDTGAGRLDSMPNVPPPPPPTSVSPHIRYDDDDEDNVVDAPRRPTFGSRQCPTRLPPIDDSSLYNVPPGLQRDVKLIEDESVRPGSNSSSSRGSVYGIDGKHTARMEATPDYINTQESRCSGSYSAPDHFSGSSISSGGHLSVSPANLRNQIYDFPSQLSPVFPMSNSPNPPSQTLPSLESTILSRNVVSSEPQKTELSVKEQLKDVKMLDVSGLLLSQTESPYTSAQDLGVQRPSELNVSKDEDTYAVPPARPPKPNCPAVNSQPESLYSSPRNHSSSSMGAVEQSTYDTVKRPIPLSPPHTSIMGTTTPVSPRSQKMPPFCTRNAISASNSPMATPDMSRRNEITKTQSFTSRMSPLVQKNNTVSGSAPSVYDAPRQLIKMPPSAPDTTKLSQSSPTSGSGNVFGVDEANVYDLPRKQTAVSPQGPVVQEPDAKVDDIMHPAYERMAALSDFSNDTVDDPYLYTAMAGVNATPELTTFMTQVPPVRQLHPRLTDDIPPPVHRDLKPGRKSLGSDGGSSQSGSDVRKKNSRDSYGSDEAISPPHTSVTHIIPLVTEQKQFPYGVNISPTVSRSGSITSPQRSKFGRGEDRMGSSPTPPQRPPKSSLSSASPRSPPMPTSPNQPGLYASSQGSSLKSPQPGHDYYIAKSAVLPPAPERPPKPISMRFSHASSKVRDDSRMPPKRPPKSVDDPSFTPSRPPKPSIKTPSTGDSLNSAKSLQSSFFPHQLSYGPSSIVPPAPDIEQMEREIKYIEISTAQNNTQTHLPDAQQDRNLPQEPVEYIEIDVHRTRALEIMRQRRLQQRATSDTHSVGKGKD